MPFPRSEQPDLTLWLDPPTLEYTGYCEHRPGGLLIPAERFMNRRLIDVAPSPIAKLIDCAARKARACAPQRVEYVLHDVWTRAEVRKDRLRLMLKVRRLVAFWLVWASVA